MPVSVLKVGNPNQTKIGPVELLLIYSSHLQFFSVVGGVDEGVVQAQRIGEPRVYLCAHTMIMAAHRIEGHAV